jgi:hypothetical protein
MSIHLRWAPSGRRRLLRLTSELTAQAVGRPAVAMRSASTSTVDDAVRPAALSEAEIHSFNEQGFIICEGLLTPQHCAALMQDMDQLMTELAETRGLSTDRGTDLAMSNEIAQTETLGALPSFPPIVERVRCLMQANTSKGGTGLFSLHHQHGARMDPGVGPRACESVPLFGPRCRSSTILLARCLHVLLKQRGSDFSVGRYVQGTKTTSSTHRLTATS